MRKRLLPMLAFLLAACGSEEATPETEAEPAETAEEATPEPAPAPEPPPEPEPVADCPTDTWSVAANGPNQATDSGVEAAGWARQMGSGWERLRVCKTIDEFEHLMSCAPVEGGAECSVGLPDQLCTATLPGPTVPIAVGQWVDTHELPSEGSWNCADR